MTFPRPSCKVFLVGEGKSDVGDLAIERSYRSGKEGFFQPVLRKLTAPFDLEFEGQRITSLKARPTTVGKLRRSKAAQALALAFDEGCSILVWARDLDRQGGTPASGVERRKRWRILREGLESDLDVARANDEDFRSIATIVAVPCRMIEAWVLGDRTALAEANGGALEEVPPPGSPEAYWGREDDPTSMHPKRVLERAVDGRCGFAKVAEHASVEELAQSCPDSFAPFVASARKCVQKCGDRRMRGGPERRG